LDFLALQDLRYQARSKAKRFAVDEATDGRKRSEQADKLSMRNSVQGYPGCESGILSRNRSPVNGSVPQTVSVEIQPEFYTISEAISAAPRDSLLNHESHQPMPWMEWDATNTEVFSLLNLPVHNTGKQVKSDPFVYNAIVAQEMSCKTITNPKQDLEISLKRISLESIHSASLSSDVLEPML
jgi:hypothetical protein